MRRNRSRCLNYLVAGRTGQIEGQSGMGHWSGMIRHGRKRPSADGTTNHRVRSDLVLMVVLAAVYFGAGKFGLRLAFLNQSASAVWPPTGIALAAVLLFGYRIWPGIWLGAFLVNITTAGTLATTIGIATGNTLEPLLGAWLVQRYANGRQAFERARDIFWFVLLAAVLSTAVSATFGVTSLALVGFVHGNNYAAIWITWWLGDAVSALIIAPLILIWSSTPFPHWRREQIVEGLLAFISVLLVGRLVFGGLLPPPISQYSQTFVCFPPLLWTAFRFGRRGAIGACFALAIVVLWGTVHGSGPFALPDRNQSLLLVQAFMGTITVTTLVLGAVVSERQRAERALRESRARLAGLIDSAMDAIIAVDAGQRVVLFNPAAERMFGCTAAEALGRPLDRFVPARFREAHRRHIESFGRTGATNRRMGALGALNGVRTNGEEFPIEASISHMKVGGQKLFTVIVRDITERKRAETELQTWQRELESRVEKRTEELTLTHRQLEEEIEERKRLEAEIAQIVEREQLRLGQELHDGIGQQLTGIGYLLTALQTKLKKVSPTRAREVRRLQTMIEQSVEQTRSLARGFYPVELERLGLRAALEEFAHHIERSFGVPCTVQSDGSACGELKGPLAFQLFRIAQEATHNAAKHAHAKRIVVRLGASEGTITLVVKDDGFGFPPGTNGAAGMGMRIMRHRAGMIGGKLLVHNEPQGGVSVTCSVSQKP